MIKKIITHNGQFHADEIFACALILLTVGDVPIERTRTISIEDINDPEIWIIDVAQVFDKELHNFDHHQDQLSPASNMLVLNHLHQSGVVSDELYERLYNTFEAISLIDTNGYENTNGFQVNSLIKSLNSLLIDGFNVAINLAKSYILAKMYDVEVAGESRKIYDSGERIAFSTILCEQYPVFWKSYDDATFLIAPDQNGKWCVHSINSNLAPLIPTGKEEFFHQAKFVAVYSSKEDAIESGRQQAINAFG